MTNQEYIQIFEQFARKKAFEHKPEENQIRFCQYEISGNNFMPDLTKYTLDLNSFCLCISHLDISINGESADQYKKTYRTNLLIIKAFDPNTEISEQETIDQAQQRADWLWANLLHYEQCVQTPQKRAGWFWGSIKLGRDFSQNDIVGLTNNACGIEMQFSMWESITHQKTIQKYSHFD